VTRAQHADLLVLGRSGHSAIWGRFIGTTAEKVARHVECSVLIAICPLQQLGEDMLLGLTGLPTTGCQWGRVSTKASSSRL
jgi:hypothetical protein